MIVPVSKTDKNHALKREELWQAINSSKKDRCTQAELERGLKTIITTNLNECKHQIGKAYNFTKFVVSSRGPLGIDYMEKKELRAFLVALKQRFEYLHVFKNVTGQKSQENIEISEFIANKILIQKWVGTIQVPNKEFENLKKNGTVNFNDMCEWSCKTNFERDGDKF